MTPHYEPRSELNSSFGSGRDSSLMLTASGTSDSSDGEARDAKNLEEHCGILQKIPKAGTQHRVMGMGIKRLTLENVFACLALGVLMHEGEIDCCCCVTE